MPAAGLLITHYKSYYSAQPVSPVLLTACRRMPTHHTDYSLLIFGNRASDKRAGVTLTLTDYPLLLLSAGNACSHDFIVSSVFLSFMALLFVLLLLPIDLP